MLLVDLGIGDAVVCGVVIADGGGGLAYGADIIGGGDRWCWNYFFVGGDDPRC